MTPVPSLAHQVTPQAATRIALSCRHADLTDAFRILLPPGTARDAETLARFMFAQPAPGVALLMTIRDLLVAPLGLKTSASLRAGSTPEAVEAADRIGMFRVFWRSRDEVVVGENDRHLDFRVSMLLEPSTLHAAGPATLVVTSVVHCHNRLGRVYLRLIAPFHRRIVAATLDRAARAGWPAAVSEPVAATSSPLADPPAAGTVAESVNRGASL